MRFIRASLARLLGTFASSRRERELADEIASHLQLHIDDNARAGLSPADARRRALIALGGVDALKDAYRDRRGLPVLENAARDVRFAFRMMRKAPGFTFVAIGALALGISVNTTVFTAFDAIALKPLDVKAPEQLARVYRATSNDPFGALSYADYLYYHDHSRTLSDVAILAFGMGLTSSDVPVPAAARTPRVAGALGFHLPQLLEGSARPIGCLFVSGNYFPMLGATATAGRLVDPGDDLAGAPPVVVLSGNFWMRQFHGDPSIVGSMLHLNGVPFLVIGVTPIDYVATAQNVPDLWAPLAAKLRLGVSAAQMADPDVLAGWVQGRMRPGVSLADAQAELNVLAGRLRQDDPRPSHRAGITVASGRTYAPPFDRTAVTVTVAALASVLLLLLIACTNVASLLLARAAVRRREIAVRLSIGASRGRLLQQLLTESILLACVAGAAGLVLSMWMLRLLVDEVSSSLPDYWGSIAIQTSPDLRVFAYTACVSLLTGIAFGLAPALQTSRVNLTGALKDDGGAATAHVSRRRLLDTFVLAQIAACLVLLVSSALLLRSSQAALHADPGFETRHVVQMQLMPAGVSAARAGDVSRRIAGGASAIPGVRHVAHAVRQPMLFGVRRIPVVPGGDVPFNLVSPNYFAALDIPMLRGRTFTAAETGAGAGVAVISAAMAQRAFPGGEALGRRLSIGDMSKRLHDADEADVPARTVEVIGVAADVRSLDFRRIDDAYLYLPLSPRQAAGTTLVRTDGDPWALLSTIGAQIRRADPDLPIFAGVLDAMVSLDPRFVVSRIGGALAAIVAAVGLLMASLGVYGMVGYSVSQRTREIGIRMALGAERLEVLRLVLGEGARPVALGAALGVLASAGAARLLSSMLFGVGAFDAVSFGAASLLLGTTAVVAIWLPARRATRVDPMIALRHE
jgi:macrolide transport system ATP-binding/permease protein